MLNAFWKKKKEIGKKRKEIRLERDRAGRSLCLRPLKTSLGICNAWRSRIESPRRQNAGARCSRDERFKKCPRRDF